jgi:hypothetical protein
LKDLRNAVNLFFVSIKRALWRSLSSGFIVSKEIPKNIDIILECRDVNRSVIKNGLAYAQILDRLQDQLTAAGYACITLARMNSILINNAYGTVISPVTLLEEVLGMLLLLLRKFKIFSRVADSYWTYLYLTVLRKSNCRIVIGIQPTRYLVAASKISKLPVVDLLHGYGIRSSHNVYGCDAVSQISIQYLCTDFIALDKNSQMVIDNSLGLCNKEARSWSLLSPVLQKKMIESELCDLKQIYAPYEKVILITLQWGIDRFERIYPHVDGELHPRIHELISHEKQKKNLFIIKPHPVMLIDNGVMKLLYSNYSNIENVYVDEKTELLDLLMLVDSHITIWSSTVREASFLGVKSLLFSSDEHFFQGINYLYQPELESKMVNRVNDWSISQIIDWLNTSTKIDIEDNPQYLECVYPEYDDGVQIINEILQSPH